MKKIHPIASKGFILIWRSKAKSFVDLFIRARSHPLALGHTKNYSVDNQLTNFTIEAGLGKLDKAFAHLHHKGLNVYGISY